VQLITAYSGIGKSMEATQMLTFTENEALLLEPQLYTSSIENKNLTDSVSA
jgi:hypothetical protein